MRGPLRRLVAELRRTARPCGIEIGAHTLPVPGVTPFYLDRVFAYADIQGRVDVQADALALPIPSDALDFVCSSHVLEHLANPIAGLLEWWRVLRRDGLLYLVVPDQRFTFDRSRATTTVAHLVDEFLRGIDRADEAHIRDFIFATDWKQFGMPPDPEGPERQRQKHFEHYLSRLRAGRPVDIHYHTFTPVSLHALLDRSGLTGGTRPRFKMLAAAERYPPGRRDGIALLLRKLDGGDASRELRTFELSHPAQRSRPLRLVCPVTLAPLSVDGAANGERAIELVGPSARYQIKDAVPQLVPADPASVQRDWNDPAWREALIAAGGRRPTFWRRVASSLRRG